MFRALTAARSLVHRPPKSARAFTHAAPACPSCRQPLPSALPACTSCWTLFALPPDLTHHSLLSLEYEPNPFAIEIPALKHRFRRAQTICHPDAWASKGPNKQEVAQALSSRVNEAYQTLLHPLPRAEYILARNGVPVSETDQASDPKLMADVMEVRETIEDAVDPADVMLLVEDNKGNIDAAVHELSAYIGAKDWNGAKAAAVKLRFLEGIDRAGHHWLRKYGEHEIN